MTILVSRPTTSPRLDLGPESGDHLSVRVLRRLHPCAVDADAGWLVCPVHVHVGGFSGDVESVEQWIDVTVTREVDGSFTATGHLADEPGSGSRLRFRIAGLDHASLDACVAACASATELYPLPASA